MKPNNAAAALWSKRFSEPVDQLVERFGASVGFDQRLGLVDIRGSLAHAQMLMEIGVLSADEHRAIAEGLAGIAQDIAQGRFQWQLKREDVHMNIELELTARIGEAGKKLHTARSRNDQVATDLRLFAREAVDRLQVLVAELARALLLQAEQHTTTLMPGFTHLQVAQPVSFAHHLLAYEQMLKRDAERLSQARSRINQLPLGAAALAGTSFAINRHRVAELLGFEGVCANSLDAVSDRDFVIELVGVLSLLMVHLSRLCEEVILWSSQSFGFVELSDGYCTGSSIMPQKKNPDVPELVRGKTGRVVGHLMGLLVLMKAQPLAYNKDNQEDKEPLFDAIDTASDCLQVMAGMLSQLKVKPEAMRQALRRGHASATDLADALVRQGLPFREAHATVAEAVKLAEDQGLGLDQLPLDQLRQLSPLIGAEQQQSLSFEASLRARAHFGGTAPEAVQQALATARAHWGER